MARKIFIISVIFLLGCTLIFLLLIKPKTANIEPDVSYSPTLAQTNPYKDNFDGFRVDWIEISDVSKLALYSNLDSKKSSKQLLSENNCKFLISAGFYNKDIKHIGLFVSEGKLKSKAIVDNFFDGFFYINKGYPQISLNPPGMAEFALQSGPVLLLNDKFLLKTYPNDDYARRILLGITRKGSVVFVVLYGDNKIVGPKLADIQSIIEKLESKSQIDFVDLINLDGGSHSTFITDTVSIPELSLIGGYFCVIF